MGGGQEARQPGKMIYEGVWSVPENMYYEDQGAWVASAAVGSGWESASRDAFVFRDSMVAVGGYLHASDGEGKIRDDYTCKGLCQLLTAPNAECFARIVCVAD